MRPGNGGGFFYLTSSGEVISVPSPKGFEEHYVLLHDACFFEVSGPLAAAQGGAQGGGGEEVAARLRAAFRARAMVLRVLYAASTGPRAVDAMARQVSERGESCTLSGIMWCLRLRILRRVTSM